MSTDKPVAWLCGNCGDVSSTEGAGPGDNWCGSCAVCGVMQPLYTAAQLAAAVAEEREAWEKAIKLALLTVDPLRPAGQPGSYARGNDNGFLAAVETIRANLAAIRRRTA